MLAARDLLPVRDGRQLAHYLVAHPDKVFIYDGVERGILRDADQEEQAEEYSTKKKPIVQKIISGAMIRSICTLFRPPNPGGCTISTAPTSTPCACRRAACCARI